MCPGINTFIFRVSLHFTIADCSAVSGAWRCLPCVRPEADGQRGRGVGEGLYGPPAECVRPEADGHRGGRMRANVDNTGLKRTGSAILLKANEICVFRANELRDLTLLLCDG